MNNIAALSAVLLIIGITASFVEGSILWGVLPFLLALGNELARMLILARGPANAEED